MVHTFMTKVVMCPHTECDIPRASSSSHGLVDKLTCVQFPYKSLVAPVHHNSRSLHVGTSEPS